MRNIVFGLAVAMALAAGGAMAAETVAGAAHSAGATAQTVPKGMVHRIHSALSSAECTALGGTVSDSTTCASTGKVCTTITYNHVTHQEKTNTACVTTQ
jgi:hypothetical protein